MHIPEYSVSLLLWIVPVACLCCFFVHKRILCPEKIFALAITVAVLALVGIVLDLAFARVFFLFPDPRMVCGIFIQRVPVEEFVFYITGFWFVIFMYVFGDEWFLKKYNRPDTRYARYRARLRRRIFLHNKSVIWAVLLGASGIAVKHFLNPQGGVLPGYYVFLTIAAYTPAIVFYRVTRPFVNWRALMFCLVVTVLVSLMWEATLALPRGYWNYQHGAMLGIFVGVWSSLPIEAVTVWIASTLAVLVYEYVKIRYFTKAPSVPLHRQLLKIGKEWRPPRRQYHG